MYQSTPEYIPPYVGVDRKGSEFVGNKQTNNQTLNFVY